EVQCPSGWRSPTSTNWDARFVRGRGASPSAPTSGGSDTHTHDATHDHGDLTAAPQGHYVQRGETDAGTTTGEVGAGLIQQKAQTGASAGIFGIGAHSHNPSDDFEPAEHTHSTQAATPSFSQESSIPEYREFVLCERDL